MVKLEDRQLAKSIGVFAHPSLVIFRQYGKEAVIYAGDLKSKEAILEWLLIQKDPENEAIEDLDGEALARAIRREEAVAVFVYQHDEGGGCERCLSVLRSLEDIDDDASRHSIRLLKTTDKEFAEDIGTTDNLPALVFFRSGGGGDEEDGGGGGRGWGGGGGPAVPNVFEGDISAEEEVLDWLIEMKVESHIELITRSMLEAMVDEVQYLAVFFCKYHYFCAVAHCRL